MLQTSAKFLRFFYVDLVSSKILGHISNSKWRQNCSLIQSLYLKDKELLNEKRKNVMTEIENDIQKNFSCCASLLNRILGTLLKE